MINDYYDYTIDMINRKERVLPSGMISPRKAKYYAICLFISGIIISVFLQNGWMIAIAALNSFLLYVYAMKSKRIHFWGNLLVAFVTASTFVFGSFITNNLRNAFFVALCAFFYSMIRELVKDIEDKNGDSSADAKTLPLLWGDKKNTSAFTALLDRIHSNNYLGLSGILFLNILHLIIDCYCIFASN